MSNAILIFTVSKKKQKPLTRIVQCYWILLQCTELACFIPDLQASMQYLKSVVVQVGSNEGVQNFEAEGNIGIHWIFQFVLPLNELHKMTGYYSRITWLGVSNPSSSRVPLSSARMLSLPVYRYLLSSTTQPNWHIKMCCWGHLWCCLPSLAQQAMG